MGLAESYIGLEDYENAYSVIIRGITEIGQIGFVTFGTDVVAVKRELK